MKRNRLIGFLAISIGFLVLFYKDSGHYSFGGYIDKAWENIFISSILVIIGILFIRRRNEIN